MEKNLVIKNFKAEFQNQGEEIRGYMKFIINNEYEIINIVPYSINKLIPTITDEDISKTIRFIDGIIYTNLFEKYRFKSIEFEDIEEHRRIILNAIVKTI